MDINKYWSEIDENENTVIVEEFLNGIRNSLMDKDATSVHLKYNFGLPPHNFGRDMLFKYETTDTITIEVGRVKEINSH